MGTLDPRLDCVLHMTESEQQAAPGLSYAQPEGFLEAMGAGEAPELTSRVFIRLRGAPATEGEALAAPGVTVRARLGNVVTAEATNDGLKALQNHPDVVYVEPAKPLLPTETAAANPIKIDLPSSPLDQTGKGVIVGIVDWGCDPTHDDFRDADGRSRLLAIWDQSATSGPGQQPPAGYSTGVEFTRDRINAALGAADPFAELGLTPPPVAAHGTHVMGCAAGNGRADPAAGLRGLAPDADLIFVQPDTSDVNPQGGFGDSVQLAESVQYIFDQAAKLGRPAVVNLSMGTNSGPHDGTSLVEQWIDRLLSEPGRAVVLALGNEHNERFIRTHSEGQLAPGETTTLYWRVLPNDFSPNEVEIWYSSRDLFELEVELPDGSRLERIAPGQSKMSDIPGSTTRVYQSHTICSPLNGDNCLNVIQVGEQTAAIIPGVWRLHLKALRARDGAFDAWIERDSMQGTARMSSFVGGSYVRRKTLGSIQSSRFAVTVSNYDAFTTTLADSTSFGPTRDGRRAPTVAAPGTDIRAAKSRWRDDPQEQAPYTAKTGTSMAAPYVAGLIACMLEKAPQLTAAQIRGFLMAQAKPAPGMDDEWRIDWGYGRVDPIDTLEAIPAPV